MSNTLVVPELLCPNVFTIGVSDEVPNTGEYLSVGDFREAGYDLGMIKANGTYAFNMLAYHYAFDFPSAYWQMQNDFINPYAEYRRTKAVLLGTQAVFNTLTEVTQNGLVLGGVKTQTIKVIKAVFDIYDEEDSAEPSDIDSD